VYPKEEPQPAGLLSSITLRPYQKQSLAFMIDLERSTQPETAGRVGGRTVRGGWLADEMGMGKTAVVTALCLANPPGPVPGGKAVVGGSGGGGSSSSTTTLKLTLVIVSNTLVKQWEDEVKQFAPSLRVHSLYQGAGEGRAAALANLSQVDVLITTPHAKWPAELCSETATKRIHRLVVDESHLLGGKSWKAQQGKLLRVPANHVWCVTGTPFSAGLPDLDYQARLLGHWSDGMHLSVKIKGVNKVSEMTQAQLAQYMLPGGSLRSIGKLSSEEVVAELRTLMIRHVKAQRIGGEVALALPDASSETVWLQMSADEKLLYGLHACYDGKPEWSKLVTLSKKDLHKLDELERGLTRRRDATCHAYSAKAVASGGDIEGSTDPARAAACAAFLRMHTKGTPATDRLGEVDDDSKWKVKPEACTKYQALLDDMATLRQRERQCKVVVFTSRSRVQQELVELVKASPKVGASTWTIFEFNRDTPPLRRHRLIHDFQHGSTNKPCVFIVTYETAAVGITLTAATRVYLMEPAIDPAQAFRTLRSRTPHLCPATDPNTQDLRPVYSRLRVRPPRTWRRRRRRRGASTGSARPRRSTSSASPSKIPSTRPLPRCTIRSRAAPSN
jgi:SNF2 family DNA or RNA helicase